MSPVTFVRKNPKLAALIIFVLFCVIACDRDAFVHLEYAARFFELGLYEQAVVELKTANRFLRDEEYFQQSPYRDLMWGIIHLKQGKQAESIASFEQALRKAPDETQIRLLLASLYTQQQDFASALKLFQDKKYLTISYGAADYVAGLQAYYRGKHQLALEHFDKTLEKVNQEYIIFSGNQRVVAEQMRLAVYTLCGEGALQLQDYVLAARYFARALEIDRASQLLEAKLKIALLFAQQKIEPQNSGIYASLGYYYSLLNLPDRSIAYYQEALQKAPHSAPAYLGLALAHKNKQDHLTARKYLSEALRCAQDKTLLASICLELGQTYTVYSDHTRALEFYSEGLKYDPQNLSIQNERAHAVLLLKEKMLIKDYELTLELAGSYLTRQNYPNALRYYNLAETLRPGALPALLGQARVYYLQKDYPRAHSLYGAVLRNRPEEQEALIGLTDVYLSEEKYDQALRYLQRALAKDADNVLLRNKLAYVYFYAGRAHDAAKEWRFVLRNINNAELADVLVKILEVIE